MTHGELIDKATTLEDRLKKAEELLREWYWDDDHARRKKDKAFIPSKLAYETDLFLRGK